MPRRNEYTTTEDEAFIASLNEELGDIQRRVDENQESVEFIADVTILGHETMVRHTLNTIPTEIIVMPKDDQSKHYKPAVFWWLTKNSTDTAIYLEAEREIKADITLRG